MSLHGFTFLEEERMSDVSESLVYLTLVNLLLTLENTRKNK